MKILKGISVVAAVALGLAALGSAARPATTSDVYVGGQTSEPGLNSGLVLDNGSSDDLTPRIATAMPKAFVRRRTTTDANGQGFAEAANEALKKAVE